MRAICDIAISASRRALAAKNHHLVMSAEWHFGGAKRRRSMRMFVVCALPSIIAARQAEDVVTNDKPTPGDDITRGSKNDRSKKSGVIGQSASRRVLALAARRLALSRCRCLCCSSCLRGAAQAPRRGRIASTSKQQNILLFRRDILWRRARTRASNEWGERGGVACCAPPCLRHSSGNAGGKCFLRGIRQQRR